MDGECSVWMDRPWQKHPPLGSRSLPVALRRSSRSFSSLRTSLLFGGPASFCLPFAFAGCAAWALEGILSDGREDPLLAHAVLFILRGVPSVQGSDMKSRLSERDVEDDEDDEEERQAVSVDDV